MPRRAYKQKSTPYSDVKKRWVPKAVLQAQGYYQGAKLVWIPKAKPLTPPTLPTESKTPKTKDTLLGETPEKPTKYWCPKQPHKSNATREPNKTTKPERTRKIWVPKQKQSLVNSDKEKPSEIAQTTQQFVPTHENLGNKNKYLTIKERARALQIKLFGLRSLPTI